MSQGCKGTADDWDARYREVDFLFGTEPNAFVRSEAYRLPANSRVLLPGDGEGRNSVWLAGLGHQPLAVDFSEVGLRKAEALAAERGVAIETECADLLAWAWPVGGFQAVVATYFHVHASHRSRLHRAMIGALEPGGVLILEAFSPAQIELKAKYGSGGPGERALLYGTDDLADDFAAAEVLQLEELRFELDEGPKHKGPAAIVRALVRRPA